MAVIYVVLWPITLVKPRPSEALMAATSQSCKFWPWGFECCKVNPVRCARNTPTLTFGIEINFFDFEGGVQVK